MMNPIQSFFFFFLSLICSTLSSPTLQMDALLEFKNEFPFSAPNPNASFDFSFSWWNTSTNHCSWKGVTCNANSGAVISLVLEDIVLNGSLKANTSLLKLQHLQNLTLCNCILRGEIPSSLGNLSHLMQLDLFNNDLVGKIPSSLGSLSHLKHLTLSSNDLVGKIPSSLGSLSHLIQLDLSYNDLVGEIPSSLGNLSHLIELDLNSNSLIGEIPTSLGNLNQLTFMSFSSNNLTGHVPSSFANFNKLSNLDLSRNQFSGGDLPLILSNLTSLSELDLSSNHFKSKLPSNMSRLHNLKVFDVKRNYFLGNVPTSLFMIPMLLGVYLRGNQFEGPLEFGNTSASSRLVSLDLSSNNFHEPIPEDIFRFLKLETLDLSNNSFTGAISRSMSKLVSLRFLDLSYNKMEGQVPSFLWSLDTLTLSHNYFSSLEEVVVNGSHSDLSSNSLQVLVFKVDLGSNSLQGSFPLWIYIFANATDVLYLDVSRNQLMGKLPKSLINCKYMHYLNLKGNKFNDTFPYWLGSLVSLRVLILGSNAFYGPVSSHVGFPSLKIIDISHNSFNGTLPQDYFVNWLEMSTVWVDYEGIRGSLYMGAINHTDSMDMMYKGVDTEFPLIFLGFKAIDFSGNKFTGRIPKSVGLLKDLRHVNFSRNAFTGSIPSSLAKLTNLEALDLSHNKLSGNIPRDLARLSFMSYMDFSHNLLQGPVPRSTQFQSQNCSSFEDNLGLYGLETICGPIHGPHPTPGDSHQSEEFSSEESEEVLSWIAAAIAFGPGVFCGLVIGYIFFTSQKHIWFMEKFGRNYPRGIITVG
ncbi:receptor-like protein 12 [Brassica napus]|uniref:receptor-like protein 12 n=1 Tax=Brassica napus TaxID=3708 RepID=UPI002078772F|nr:receptor-like protein 12 [Brassica napus]XP_048638383.1 receptor-like protein 12 [Brassica napus]